MILYASTPSSIIFSKRNAPQQATPRRPSPFNCARQSSQDAPNGGNPKPLSSFPRLFCHNHCSCICGRRLFIEAAATSLFPLSSSMASSNSSSDYTAILNRVHPPKPDWYEDFYASVLANGMKLYEAEIADYKSQMFATLRGKAQKVLEIGIGAGPNLKYYAGEEGMKVYGVDPNPKMEKYAREAAQSAGLPADNFEFKQAVGEAIPLPDASVDVVVGTLVLCSVSNVDMTLKEVKRVLRPSGLYIFVEHVAAEEGTVLRFVQDVLDPVQQLVSDGCHLTRRTGQSISEAGFSNVDLNMASFSNAAFINPQVYGVAHR
ncbi:methyltransferase-like protein 7A isoform X1 [Cucurbita maxima]|uniref:Methyltransferase-like protein 7A isoform X1 n=1 Tax=Cucurbita maxima TaxID=3661 RepID=A0A6J1HSK1_CUCMA|nr:methyltransferase-like protein 7A isoform X1 [Cucurbita maxima]XP_022968083.1 methyltransferase-like protein 7A isoform X1 [Cucurbita maxima]